MNLHAVSNNADCCFKGLDERTEPNSRWYQGNIRPVDALDTMGAGDSYITAFVVSCLSHGWSKKQPLDAEIIRDAMEFAADYSAKNCLKPGGFGFEHKLAEMKDGQASIS